MKKIYSFPYAGGSASAFRNFSKKFNSPNWEFVPLEIPGRGKRSAEPFSENFADCIARSFDFDRFTAEPYVIHGHCMGALIAYEAVKTIERLGLPAPLFLCVSARNAPCHVNNWARSVAGLDEEALFKELELVGGTPKGLSYAMAEPFMKIFKEDQRLAREYQPDHLPVCTRILAIGGSGDSMTDAAGLSDWAKYTNAEVEVKMLSGQHYFIFDQPHVIHSLIENFPGNEPAARD